MKKAVAYFLALVTLLTSICAISGCGGDSKVKIYSRGEWINQVANVFSLNTPYEKKPYFSDVTEKNEYFDEIQACAEWEIIDKNGKFEPDKRADVNFAMLTAVKAIGLDKIAKSVDGKELKSDKEIINYFNDKSDVKYIAGSSLYMDTAEHILEDVGTIYSSLELKQHQDIKLKENVVSPEKGDVVFSADGQTATVRNGTYNTGDIICLEPSTVYPEGKYAKVTSVDGDKITYEEPTLDEIADHITISGTYTPEILGVVPLMDGVVVNSIGGSAVKPQSYGVDGNSIIYLKDTASSEDSLPLAETFNLGEVCSFSLTEGIVTGSISLKNVVVTTDIDVSGIIVKKADISVTDTIEANLSISAKYDKTIDIAYVPCTLYGIVGVNFVLAAKIGLEGRISFTFTVDTSESMEYKPFRTPKFSARGYNPNFEVELKAKAYIDPEFRAELVAGPVAVASLGAYSGVEATADAKYSFTDGGPSCTDINAYVPLVIFVGDSEGGNGTLLGKLGIKKTFTIWDASSSPIKKHWHIEDAEIVPECTKGNNNGESENGSDNATTENGEGSENGESTIDTEFINEVLNIYRGLSVSSWFVSIEENRNDTLRVTKLPEGYSESDIVFSSDNTSVATVQNDGTIHAVGYGSCTIKVSTSDGKYNTYCTVNVLASYDVDFTPLAPLLFEGEDSYDIAA